MRFEQAPLLMATMVHPREYETQKEFQKSGVYDWVTNTLSQLKMEIDNLPYLRLNGFLVTKNTSPRIYGIYKKVLKRLNCNQEYPLYITYGYDLKAEIYGSEYNGYIIAVNSFCLDELDDDELTALLGQQVGHILAAHGQNIELLRLVEQGVAQIPVIGTLAGKKIWSYFAEWILASSYTADRAGAYAAGSIQTMISLIKKQIGAIDEFQSYEAMAENVPEEHVKPGIYYVWIAQNTLQFGAVARMRELVEWSRTESFKEHFPYMYYMENVARGLDEDTEIANYHLRAENHDEDAVAILGEAYLFGKRLSVPVEGHIAVSLLEEAAFNGNGRCMYFLSECMDKEYGGVKRNEDLIVQLRRAAVSLDNDVANMINVSKAQKTDRLSEVCRKFVKSRTNHSCKINTENIGQPLKEDEVKNLYGAFWIPVSDKIYAAEYFVEKTGIYGLVVADSGIYGRLNGERFPFHIEWTSFLNSELTGTPEENGGYVKSGKKKIFEYTTLAGSVCEILIMLKE